MPQDEFYSLVLKSYYNFYLYYIHLNLKSLCVLASLLALLHFFCGRGMYKLSLNCMAAVNDAKEVVQREVDQAFPWQFIVRGHSNITKLHCNSFGSSL